MYKFDIIRFSIFETVFDIFRKKCFWKFFVRCYGFLKRLFVGLIALFFFSFLSFFAGNLVSSVQHSRGNVSAKLGGGDSRYFAPLYLKNCLTYQNEHGSRSSSAPFFFFEIESRFFLGLLGKTRKTDFRLWRRNGKSTFSSKTLSKTITLLPV